MRLIELESEAVLRDLSGAAAAAAGDICSAKEAMASAEKDLAAAVAECDRLYKRQGELTSRASVLASRARDAKVLYLRGAANRDDAAGLGTYRKISTERDDCTSALSFVVSFAIPAAERARLLAEIEERTRAADLFEAAAVAHRLRAAEIASRAAEFDPGVHLAVEGSWSSQEIDRATRIRTNVVPALKQQLGVLDEATEREQALVAPALLN